jgi:hypothetical protein
MANDLKTENTRSVYYILTASLVLSALFQIDLESANRVMEFVVAGTGSVILSAVLVLIANLMPQTLKHKLVFTRLKNELPACRVDRLCKSDPRIELASVETRWPDIFEHNVSGAVRNSIWYQQIYKPVKDMPEVRQAHRGFLLYRDAFSGLLLILTATLILSWVGEPHFLGEIKTEVFLVQVTLVLLSMIASRVAGNRFVINAVVAAV